MIFLGNGEGLPAGLGRENRTLHMVAECNQALLRATDEIELMESICRIVVEKGGYRMAWVGFAEAASGVKKVRPIAHAGFEEGYLDRVLITWDEGEHGRGPTGTSIRTGKPVFIRSMRDDPHFGPWREEALARGYACSIALPLADRGQVFGALTIYAPNPDAFDEAEISLLADLAGDLAYGLRALRAAAEQARLEEGLRNSENRLALILNHVSDIIFSVTVEPGGDLRFGWVNRRFLETTGLEERRVVGEILSRVLPEPSPDFFYRKYREAVQSGKPVSWEQESGHPAGNRCGLVTIVPVFDDRGACRQLIGMVHDLTGRKRTEEEREKLRNQLFQAQKLESIGRLAGGVAHDFNNMLSVIISYTDSILRRTDPSDPLSGDLQRILAAAQHSAELTRQLLAFARKETVVPQVLDLNKTVGDMIPFLRRLLGENIDLVWRPGEDPGQVRVGSTHIDQILTNLCVNARDAIAGHGRILIETGAAAFDASHCAGHPEFSTGEFALLAVSDTGQGMGPEVLAKVFEPFYTTKGPGKGTGLGLPTVYGIVQQDKGFITVESEPGRGTAFKIYLPRFSGRPEQVLPETSAPPLARSQTTLLLVEDEPAILRITTLILQNLGYAVVGASSPSEALRLAQAQPNGIHLLVTDMVLPEMSGLELSRKLLSLYPNLKRLYMSGYAAGSIPGSDGLDEGSHFLPKPFTIQELAAKVREALG